MDPISERLLWFVLGFLSGGLTIGGIVARHHRRPAPPEAATPSVTPAAAGDPPREPASDGAAPPELDYPHVPGPARLIDVGAARAAGFNLKHAEDLTIVEGIGPKIEDLLRANGIHGFAQLASLDENELLRILDRGGSSFRFTNPEHWAREAALAAENRWKDLKRLQDERIGGATRSD